MIELAYAFPGVGENRAAYLFADDNRKMVRFEALLLTSLSLSFSLSRSRSLSLLILLMFWLIFGEQCPIRGRS